MIAKPCRHIGVHICAFIVNPSKLLGKRENIEIDFEISNLEDIFYGCNKYPPITLKKYIKYANGYFMINGDHIKLQ